MNLQTALLDHCTKTGEIFSPFPESIELGSNPNYVNSHLHFQQNQLRSVPFSVST